MPDTDGLIRGDQSFVQPKVQCSSNTQVAVNCQTATDVEGRVEMVDGDKEDVIVDQNIKIIDTQISHLQ